MIYSAAFSKNIPNFSFDGNLSAITLQADSWDDNGDQIVSIPGVSADESKQIVIPMPASLSQSAYYAAKILVVSQSIDALTFRADSVPEEDLTVYVAVMEPKAGSIEYEWWSPEMTSDTTPSPYIASSDSVSRVFYTYYAFDGIVDTDNTNFWYTGEEITQPHWISFDFGKPSTVKGIAITMRIHNGTRPGIDLVSPSKGTVEGSMDGNIWSTIMTFANWDRIDDGRTEELIFPTVENYRHYRISDMDSTRVGISEIKFLRPKSEVTV